MQCKTQSLKLSVRDMFFVMYSVLNYSNTPDPRHLELVKDLLQRVLSDQHFIPEDKLQLTKGLTQKYNVDRLMYYEVTSDIVVAIE